MSAICVQCSASYEVTDGDREYYRKVSPVFGGRRFDIPPPSHCPACRRQRRHAFRNERNLYHRKCDLTGKQILSIYAPQGPAVVYEHEAWWSDAWDPLSYGRAFDFQKPFFPQFGELLKEVPRMNIAVRNVENCDYCNLICDARNCYLVFETSHAEDCYHGYWLQKCKDCCDASFSHECERCYEIDNCYQCQMLRWSRNCTDCSESEFLLDCIGCRNCLFCVNLRQKQYCILNEQYSKEEFMRKRRECQFSSRTAVEEMKKHFEHFALLQPRKYMTAVHEENCTGHYIQECKNCIECFHGHEAEDCKYGEHVWRDAKNCMDVVTAGRGADLIYESTNTNMGAEFDAFTVQCWSSSNMLYSSECNSCSHCFGCVNLKHKSYCIFNTQFTKEQYEAFVPRIIEHMRSTGEWGEYFPTTISLFGYNESVAQEYFPMTKEEVLAQGWHWLDGEETQEHYLGPTVEIADSITEVTDECTKSIAFCAVTGKPFKVIPQELKLYRDMDVPVPLKCPYQRHRERMIKRNPLRLWSRKCTSCGSALQTTYAPGGPEKISCESCYLKAVY